MVSLSARIVLWLVFGYIICQSIGGFNRLFGLSLDSRWGMAPVLFIFLFQEYARRMHHSRGGRDTRDKIVSIVSCLILICMVLAVILVWAGVIYKQIVEGG